MPIHEIICRDCGFSGEVITLGPGAGLRCPSCGGEAAEQLMSPTSNLTGRAATNLPGAKDTGCCGSSPGFSGCAGPGSCCGKARA